ncbi:FKBP-type peptidyl-prolyl cis-trans isomerase [Hymenobacter monticola]|uniref:Peptidyl-prolyl cis-trans isomerase n=1 Tax=Hymenobacter monticola TaxID=1705399 RepID=A0ABY4B9L4_9BACT|nr:FKBP-type peptidyl-prolyl cis-trans isomerase [Hymenobacter monticola]UOE35869.1 FKBP-type peptidyl-prolyl cis-trans isomerase [Hymenobacter monticola]
MKNLLLRSRYWVLAACLLLATPSLWSCNSQNANQKVLADHDSQMRAIDEDTIKNYLNRNRLLAIATRTNSGLYLVPIVDGTGPQVTKGAQVRLKYVGRFLSNGANPGTSSGYPASAGNPSYPQGTIFDNSADNKTQCGCVVFTGGSGGIAGFNEGLLLMRKGDRKLLLVPSRLAYGPNGVTGIPPDSALMFDVEILDVL